MTDAGRSYWLLAGQFAALGLLALPDRPPAGKRPGPLRKAVGRTLMLGGGVLALAGGLALGPELRPSPLPRPGATLRVHGPYAFTRHPIYAGLLIAALGRTTASNGRRHWAATLALAGVLRIKVGMEERLLGAVVDYESYGAAVPRWGLHRPGA